MIQVTLTGRLGKPAEIRNAGTTQVINFSVATDVGFGDKKHSLWVECAKFGDNVKVADFLQKGTQVLIIGEPDLRTWESNGKSGTTLTVRVDKIELLGSKNEQSQTHTPQASYSKPIDITEPVDDLPF
jgi:single-strand DNA-binding protein